MVCKVLQSMAYGPHPMVHRPEPRHDANRCRVLPVQSVIYDPCSMHSPRCQCCTIDFLWSMVYDLWSVVYDLWSMVFELTTMPMLHTW